MKLGDCYKNKTADEINQIENEYKKTIAALKKTRTKTSKSNTYNQEIINGYNVPNLMEKYFGTLAASDPWHQQNAWTYKTVETYLEKIKNPDADEIDAMLRWQLKCDAHHNR